MGSHLLRIASSIAACSVVVLGLAGCGSDGTDTPTPTDTGAPDTAVTDTGTPETGNPDTADATTTDGGDTGGDVETGGGDTDLSCEDYCTRVTGTCTAASQQYADKATCMKVCVKFDVGTATDKSGDTLGCRASHVALAAAGGTAATTHCPHAGALGGDTCGASRCDDFCKLALAQCPKSGGGVYTDLAACKAACPAFDGTKPELDATAKGKLNCLHYHLQAAFGDPTTHCGHLAITAGLPCAP